MPRVRESELPANVPTKKLRRVLVIKHPLVLVRPLSAQVLDYFITKYIEELEQQGIRVLGVHDMAVIRPTYECLLICDGPEWLDDYEEKEMH